MEVEKCDKPFMDHVNVIEEGDGTAPLYNLALINTRGKYFPGHLNCAA